MSPVTFMRILKSFILSEVVMKDALLRKYSILLVLQKLVNDDTIFKRKKQPVKMFQQVQNL